MSSINENYPSDLSSLSLFQKLNFYSKKYGLVHSLLSYAGIYNLGLWKIIGTQVTKSYRQKYLVNHHPKILNLGGGGNCLEGCLTADITPRANIYVDITKELPFGDNSIDCIFCEEAIEHIKLDNAIFLLKECHRILKQGGFMRITTPNLDWFAENSIQSVDYCVISQ